MPGLTLTNVGFLGSLNRVTNITFVTSATSTSPSITIPSGVLDGDLALLMTYANGGSTPADVTITGFTNVANSTAALTRMISAYKILTSSDGNTSIPGVDLSTDRMGLMIFRPNSPSYSITLSAINSESTAGDPAQQTITVSSLASTPVIAATFMGTAGASTRSYGTTTTEITIGASPSGFMSYLLYNQNNTLSNLTVDINDTGTATSLHSWAIQLS
jgi:hypothetical protein